MKNSILLSVHPTFFITTDVVHNKSRQKVKSNNSQKMILKNAQAVWIKCKKLFCVFDIQRTTFIQSSCKKLNIKSKKIKQANKCL
jgi:hypothetical protein